MDGEEVKAQHWRCEKMAFCYAHASVSVNVNVSVNGRVVDEVDSVVAQEGVRLVVAVANTRDDSRRELGLEEDQEPVRGHLCRNRSYGDCQTRYPWDGRVPYAYPVDLVEHSPHRDSTENGLVQAARVVEVVNV